MVRSLHFQSDRYAPSLRLCAINTVFTQVNPDGKFEGKCRKHIVKKMYTQYWIRDHVIWVLLVWKKPYKYVSVRTSWLFSNLRNRYYIWTHGVVHCRKWRKMMTTKLMPCHHHLKIKVECSWGFQSLLKTLKTNQNSNYNF